MNGPKQVGNPIEITKSDLDRSRKKAISRAGIRGLIEKAKLQERHEFPMQTFKVTCRTDPNLVCNLTIEAITSEEAINRAINHVRQRWGEKCVIKSTTSIVNPKRQAKREAKRARK